MYGIFRFYEEAVVAINVDQEGYRTILGVAEGAKEDKARLVAARLRHVASTKWGTRKYLNLELLNYQDYREALAG
jgi:transposase-like protein